MAGPRHPAATAPRDLPEWNRLVTEFLDGLLRAVRIVGDSKATEEPLAPDFTYGDALLGLAVHSAYHPGRIVAMRPQMGRWSARPEGSESESSA